MNASKWIAGGLLALTLAGCGGMTTRERDTVVGAGIGAAAGGLLGALVGLGIPREDAEFYAEGVKRGGVLVTVQASDDRASEALNIMRGANAVDVDTQRNAWRQSGWSEFDETTDPDESYTWSGRPRTY